MHVCRRLFCTYRSSSLLRSKRRCEDEVTAVHDANAIGEIQQQSIERDFICKEPESILSYRRDDTGLGGKMYPVLD